MQQHVDESPEGCEMEAREVLRDKRDRRMFSLRFAEYQKRLKLYEYARLAGEVPEGFTPVDTDR